MENVKSKPFFIINNSYASNFTLYKFLFIFESFLLFAKHFLFQSFSYSNIWEVYFAIYFFQFLKPFPRWCLFVQNNWKLICETCQICMKISEQNLFKVNNKSTGTTWKMLFCCLCCQLQRCRYWEPSQT